MQRTRRQTRPSTGEEELSLPRIDSRLLREIGVEDAEFIIDRLKSSRTVRDLLKRVLTKALDLAILRGEGKDLLKDPNYAVSQAWLAGYKTAVREAISLLTLEDDQ
jgi:hypothetical protein